MLVATTVVAIALFAIWLIASGRSGAETAGWRLDPSFTPAPESSETLVLVQEAACASGIPATGRIELSVRYSSSAVAIDIRVKPLGGDQDRQAVETPHTVTLREPLGQRDLVDANARTL